MNISDLTPATQGPRRWPRSWSPGIFHAKKETIEPLEVPKTRWKFALLLTQVGIYACLFAPIQLLIGLQASMIATPIFGALSDRTYSKYGRRAPWVLGGVLCGVFALAGLTLAWCPASLAGTWVLTQAALNAAFIATNAIPNDSVRIEYRGEMGGWLGMGQTLGVVAGTGMASAFGSLTWGYLACIALLIALVIPYLFTAHDRYLVEKPAPFNLWAFLKRFWVSPRRYPDFAWTWASRFLINLANSLCTLYLLFYLMDAVGYAHPDFGVFVLSGLYALMTVATTLAGGTISDRMGKRKPLVALSGLTMALSGLSLAFIQTWEGALLGAFLLGIGYGIYVSVDFALVTQVLPPTNDAARDLGVINIAAALPQALAPLLAAPLVKAFPDYTSGYMALYIFAALIVLVGAALVYKVKSVR